MCKLLIAQATWSNFELKKMFEIVEIHERLSKEF